ncbi:MAG: lytic transglycosylase domain-containing protein [Acidimicrobiia bacterium]|nr:lytic transglycosylase domain-containing protein [Acidimicrobiia bacterium]
MSITAIADIGGRIAQIQAEFQRNMPTNRSFAESLNAAQGSVGPTGPAAPTGPVFASPASASPAISVPIGILGTPIIVHSGHPIADGFWAGRLPAAGQTWAGEIEQAAANAGLDPRLLAAMVWQESGFRPDAVSRSGAIGLAQLMPGTADGLEVDPWDPVQNLDGGARYLAWTIEEFGSVELGLAAYNAGPGRVREAGGIPNIAETQAYVPRVLDYYRQLGGIV